MRRALATLSLSLLLISPAVGHDEKHYPNMPKEVLDWFKSQKIPGTNRSCCNDRDGVYAEEEIRGGVYWTRFEQTKGAWIPVPAAAVIHDPNRNGAPVAWFHYVNGELTIRCYAPGGGV